MAEPIEIIIRKGTTGDGGGFGISGAEKSSSRLTKMFSESDFLKNKTTGDKAIAMVTAGLVAGVKREINYAISQYGNLTGNYIGQANTEMLMQAINNATSIVGAGVGAGIATGNWIVGLVAAGIQAVNVTAGYVNQRRTFQVEVNKLNTYANIMLERSGNALLNESRGTYQ